MLSPGDEVIAGDDLYGGTYTTFTRMFEKYGLNFQFVDTNEVTNVTNAVSQSTKLVWLETSNQSIDEDCRY